MVRISVIVPTRNRPLDLRRCLAGLAECRQLLGGSRGVILHEVIVVDDASSVPGSTSAAHESALPVTVIRNASRLGAGASRRRAADIATGDVLAFLDDDAAPRGDWLAVAATIEPARPALTGRVLPFDAGMVSSARQARYDTRYAGLAPGDPVEFFAGGNSAVLAAVFHEVGGFANEGVGGDNSLAATLAERGTPVRFEPELVIAHRNGKGWSRAVADAWRAGTQHPRRLTAIEALRAVRVGAVGPSWPVRQTNRMFGVVNAIARTRQVPAPAGRAWPRPLPVEPGTAGAGRTLWFTGLPSSGKSTLAAELAAQLGGYVRVLDGDVLRSNFFPELGFSRADRIENVRRTGRLAVMLAEHGVTVLVPVIAPYRVAREWVRQLHADAGIRYAEVWVDAPLPVCVARDVKGLYAKAQRGELRGLTGLDDPYESPVDAELHLRTDLMSIQDCMGRLRELFGAVDGDTSPRHAIVGGVGR
ncbi:MAG TPA: adenylyl-sulfate kinase [Pseudonocardiaceae bacterium]